jgi:UDP-2,4-diacetamido-2,4,6-trideoxy-beta-L-altropyranose hydrolase
MSSHLIIRADADSRIGTGHIMRCLALGQAWQDAGGTVIFITCCKNETLLQRLRDENFTVVKLNAASDFQSEIINQKSPTANTWLVLDGYHFDLACQRTVRSAGFKLLLIDDYNHLSEYECDILLNQNINAPELHYCVNPDAKQLLGTQYALLRREFRRDKRVDRSIPAEAKNILVTLGGADPDNVTLKVIQALNYLNIPGLHVRIIVGPANPHIQSLRDATGLPAFDIRLLTDVKDMPELMRWADLAVSAAGSTCWELCCLGVPFITLVLAENQRGLASGLHAQKIAFCVGERPSVDQIADAVNDLAGDRENRIHRSDAGRMQVDGFGVVRALCRPAADAGLDALAGRLFLRPAAEADMELFWGWASDPTVRKNCYNPDPIALDDHKKWFSAKLASEDTLMLVIELNGIPAGQIRYDRCGDTASVGFSIDSRFRGLGLGKKLIEQSLMSAFAALNVRYIRAEVFQTNTVSRLAFLKTGFELMETCVIKGIPSFVFIKIRS